MNQAEVAKHVRSAVKSGGFDVWSSYNDKRRDGTRRVKCMRNGCDLSAAFQKKVKTHVTKALKKAGADAYVLDHGWDIGWCDYGDYHYYYAVIKA